DPRLGLEAPSQMVPAGSRPGTRQALSPRGPKLPPTLPSAFGEGTLGEAAQSAPVRLPNLATAFAQRAERLASLAPGHALEGFLRRVATVVAAQHQALAALPPGRRPGIPEIAAAPPPRPPLDPGRWSLDDGWRAALGAIVAKVDPMALPDAARDIAAHLA